MVKRIRKPRRHPSKGNASKPPPLGKEEAHAALSKITSYSQEILSMFDQKEDVSIALASTLIAAVTIAKSANAGEDQFIRECRAAFRNLNKQEP